MDTLVLSPDSNGYRIVKANNLVNTDVAGGLPRSRVDVLGGVDTVDVQWTLGPSAYRYMEAFYRSSANFGADLFQIALINGDAGLQVFSAKFAPGTYGLASQIGLSYVVAATLLVVPQPLDTSYDTSVVTAYGTYGDSSTYLLELLADLVNNGF